MDVIQSSRAQQSLDEGLDRTIEILSQHLTPTIPHNVIEYGSFINNTTYINKLNQDNNHNIANSPLPNNLLVNSISSVNSQLAGDNNLNIIQEKYENKFLELSFYFYNYCKFLFFFFFFFFFFFLILKKKM